MSNSNEPLPDNWGHPTTRRIGRIGDWNTSSSSSNNSGGSRFGSMRDIISGAGGGGGGGSLPGGDDSDDESKDPQNWFTGGERSGLNVENPDHRSRMPGGQLVRDLLRRAAAGTQAREEAAESHSSIFTGGGHTLGGEGVESEYIPDPNAEERSEAPVIRNLTFWRDGFSVEDGELRRYDDPENAQLLAEINSGRAPPSILDVSHGQPVELRVARRTDEDYVKPQKRGYGGGGHRLGAVVPGVEVEASSPIPGSFPTASSSMDMDVATPAIVTKFEVDPSKPTTNVTVRLADGTRMTCKLNTTHTVLDLRNYVNASNPGVAARPYHFMMPPNRRITDEDLTIEAADLKNSLVNQVWQ